MALRGSTGLQGGRASSLQQGRRVVATRAGGLPKSRRHVKKKGNGPPLSGQSSVGGGEVSWSRSCKRLDGICGCHWDESTEKPFCRLEEVSYGVDKVRINSSLEQNFSSCSTSNASDAGSCTEVDDGKGDSLGRHALGESSSDVSYDDWEAIEKQSFLSNDQYMLKEIVGELEEVFVILFGVGQQETEGIYSLRARSADGLPLETVIAFSTEVDAERYAGLLEASMDHTPHVCTLRISELQNFCTDAGYNLRVEPQGSLLIPPDYNVGVTDWERLLRLKSGHWSVLAEEPSLESDCADATPDFSSLWAARQLSARMGDSSEDPLDSIRLRLEALLRE